MLLSWRDSLAIHRIGQTEVSTCWNLWLPLLEWGRPG